MSPPKVDPREAEAPVPRKGAGTDAAAAGMGGPGAVTNGLVFGMSGAPFWVRWLIFVAVACVVQALDVGTTLSLARAAHLNVAPWRVLVDGYSSIAVIVLIYPPLRALCMAAHPWDGRPLRMIGMHLAGFAAFFVVHVVGQQLIRGAIYTVVDGQFALDPIEALGVLPRDALTYAIIVGLVWFILRLEARSLAPPAAAGGPSVFDIRDRARMIRAPFEAITAVRSAGNYVEFLLADGRRPLMRATMAAMEQALAGHGFVRTHRTWLVNRARVEGLAPAGSGDVAISLSGGVEALLSRRYRRTAEPLLVT